ncbi:MAG TPA: peptide deformylase [Acidimicrobiales bacterium]|nr:peptide deformylase [Acidimicrobiales bacterium]
MAVRAVVGLPNPVLAQVTPEVTAFDDALDSLITDLLDTMRASPGCVGLAAPQIGVSRRVAVIDLRGHKKAPVNHGEVVLVNPKVESRSESDVAREGCMSVPDFTGDVTRATSLVLTWQDATGAASRDAFEGFEARAVQHEIDHLDGLVFLDRVAGRAAVFRRKVYR